MKVFASYRQQATDPVIVVWPTRRAGDLSLVGLSICSKCSDLLDQLIPEFNIDTNRVYVTGFSRGLCTRLGI